MKRTVKFFAIAMAAIITASCSGNSRHDGEEVSRPSFTRGECRVVLSPICDSTKTAEHMRQYPERWKAAFDYLAACCADEPVPGEYELLTDGEVYAIVSEYVPRNPDSCRFESHRRYIDLQYIVSGCERMGIATPEELTVVEPYTDDIEFYSAEGVAGAAYAVADSSCFMTFFPDDPHRPSMAVDSAAAEAVKKVVVKIKY